MAQIRKKSVLIRTAVAFILAFSLVGQAPDPVLRSTTRLIQLNVVATDRSGKPVTDLTLEDIVLTDAGKKQNIALFTPELASPAIKPAPAEPGTVVLSNRSAQTPGAVTAILFDSLNTALLDQSEARKSCDSPIPSDLFLRGAIGSLSISRSAIHN
jgi:hypothetical protein